VAVSRHCPSLTLSPCFCMLPLSGLIAGARACLWLLGLLVRLAQAQPPIDGRWAACCIHGRTHARLACMLACLLQPPPALQLLLRVLWCRTRRACRNLDFARPRRTRPLACWCAGRRWSRGRQAASGDHQRHGEGAGLSSFCCSRASTESRPEMSVRKVAAWWIFYRRCASRPARRCITPRSSSLLCFIGGLARAGRSATVWTFTPTAHSLRLTLPSSRTQVEGRGGYSSGPVMGPASRGAR
jgi:hypothetical protein